MTFARVNVKIYADDHPGLYNFIKGMPRSAQRRHAMMVELLALGLAAKRGQFPVAHQEVAALPSQPEVTSSSAAGQMFDVDDLDSLFGPG